MAWKLYGYTTSVISSRKIETATYESIPFHFIAGGLHPDHDTIAQFRKTFLPEIEELFVVSFQYLGAIALSRSKPPRQGLGALRLFLPQFFERIPYIYVAHSSGGLAILRVRYRLYLPLVLR